MSSSALAREKTVLRVQDLRLELSNGERRWRVLFVTVSFLGGATTETTVRPVGARPAPRCRRS